jgi:transketolase
MPVFTAEDQKFEIGKAWKIKDGKDVTIIATGHLVWKAVEAEEALKEKGIDAEIINIHTLKPLDEKAIIESVKKTGCVVTAEEHQMNGGLGESVSGTLMRHFPVPQEFVAVNDSFGESGKPHELMAKYGIDTPNVIEAALKAVERKK